MNILLMLGLATGFYATAALPQSNPQVATFTMMGHTLGESQEAALVPIDTECQKVAANFSAIRDGVLKSCIKERFGELTFEDGKLVQFRGLVRGQGAQGNEIVLADAIKKFGAPTRQTLIPYQNKYGAHWNDSVTEWSFPSGIYVRLEETNDPSVILGAPTIEFESMSRHEAKKPERPNSLN